MSVGEGGIIKQRLEGEYQRKDCFLCAAAMAAGAPYDEAWARLDDELRYALGPFGIGAQSKQCDEILKRLGFNRDHGASAPGDYIVLFMLPEYASTTFLRQMLWGRRALVQVPSKNFTGEHHIIYWDGRALHDPSNKRLWTWPEVEPIYLWLFDEDKAARAPAWPQEILLT